MFETQCGAWTWNHDLPQKVSALIMLFNHWTVRRRTQVYAAKRCTSPRPPPTGGLPPYTILVCIPVYSGVYLFHLTDVTVQFNVNVESKFKSCLLCDGKRTYGWGNRSSTVVRQWICLCKSVCPV